MKNVFSYTQRVDDLMEEVRVNSTETFTKQTQEFIVSVSPIQKKISYLSDILLDIEYDNRSRKRAQE